MKNLIIFTIFLSLFNFTSPVFAADATPSAKTQDLLDRVTTKVAELTNQLRRTYSGKIKSLGTISITLGTPDGDRAITTNDVTGYFRIRGGNRSEISFSALKVGDDIVGTGTVDPQNNEMTAIQIIAKVQRYNLVGTISDINKEVITVTDFSGKTSLVDLSDTVNLKKIDAFRKIQTAKTTDFTKGSYVFVIGYLLDTNATQYSTLKALVFPQ